MLNDKRDSNNCESQPEVARSLFTNRKCKQRVETMVTESDNADKVTCLELIQDFAEHTTLHGLYHIVLRDSSVLIRIFWLLLSLLCSTLLVIQVVDRIQYFRTSPVAVNFKINYNQSLQFPAITICNQNAFRASAASEHGIYRLIEEIYRDGMETIGIKPNSTGDDIRMDELYTKLSHRREDFVVGCTWAGESCSADNFTVTLTDHGMCYTFNGFTEESPNISVSSAGTVSGAKHGLKITLNTEQYEAMPGPHDASGIKLLATSQPEFPRVEEVGMAIPTGAHAFVGLGVLVINNLPKPHGECGSRELYTTEQYTQESCTLECVTQYVVKVCGCRNFFMPDLTGTTPVCTVSQYFNCYKDAYDYINKRVVMECECPTSCKYLLYESTISYASTSANVKGHLLDYSKGSDLQKKFFNAREVTSRMQQSTYTQFKQLVGKVVDEFNNVKRLVTVDILQRIDKQIEHVKEWREDINSTVTKKQFIYDYQKYALQKNFMRARDAMEERTLNVLCLGFHEHVFNTELLLRQIYDAMNENKQKEADIYYTLLRNILQSRMDTAGRAVVNYTQLFNAYRTGERIFNYKFRDVPRSHNDAIVPTVLLNESLYHNYYANRYSGKVGTDIKRIMNASAMFGDFAEEIYTNVSHSINTTRMNKLSAYFLDACEDYFQSKSTFYFESVDRPLRVIDERRLEFDAYFAEFENTLDEIENALESLKLTVDSGFLENSETYINIAKHYFSENDASNMTKMEIARLFTSVWLGDKLHTLSLFFNDVRQKGQFIYERWSNILSTTLNIWNIIINDIDSIPYYKYANISKFLQNYTDVTNDTRVEIEHLQEETDLREVIGNTDHVFTEAMNSLRGELDKFIDESQMGETFIRENYLQLDIFFKELRHEEIEQQIAYDLIALLCDIGGSLGLFIGASVMTLFEIIDFILTNTAKGLMNSARK